MIRNLLVLLSLSASAFAAEPVLQQIHPHGGQRGSAIELTLRGYGLTEDTKILTAIPGALTRLTPEKKNSRELPFLLELAPDAPIGAYPIRVETPDGLSNTLLFSVGPFPELLEGESETAIRGAPQRFAGEGASRRGAVHRQRDSGRGRPRLLSHFRCQRPVDRFRSRGTPPGLGHRSRAGFARRRGAGRRTQQRRRRDLARCPPRGHFSGRRRIFAGSPRRPLQRSVAEFLSPEGRTSAIRRRNVSAGLETRRDRSRSSCSAAACRRL